MSDSPVLLRPGEGEDVRGRVRIKCAREGLVLTETPGPGETDPHVHHHHADAFYVLDGDFAVQLGGEEEQRLEQGSFVLAPPEVAHGYRSESGRWLNLHAPGCGFEEWLRSGLTSDFDQHEPPPGGGRPAGEAIVLEPGGGDELELGPGSRGWFKAGADDALGSVAVVEIELATGAAGPPPHYHERLTDSFCVLDGTLTVLLGDERHEAPAGSYALVPPGNVHTVSNPSEAPVRFLNVSVPSGLDTYLRELAAADPSQYASIAARHDVLVA
jgi:quercetin dioxygenase-like cupin family protein